MRSLCDKARNKDAILLSEGISTALIETQFNLSRCDENAQLRSFHPPMKDPSLASHAVSTPYIEGRAVDAAMHVQQRMV